jgi:hypothetical protein
MLKCICHFIHQTHIKHPLYSQLNWAILLCDVIPDGKNSTESSFDRQKRRPQNCFYQSIFTQRTAQFTQGIPQFSPFTCRHHDGIISRHSNSTSVSSNSFSSWASHYVFHFKYHILLHILAFFLSSRITLWPNWLAKSKLQPCFYPTQSHAQNWQKKWQTWRETIPVPENLSCFSCSFFYTFNPYPSELTPLKPNDV